MLALAWSAPAFAARDTTPRNAVVDFARCGDWEVWCIRLIKTGAVVCDLDNVLNYVPSPNVRALIPRVYLDGAGTPCVEIELEVQTSLERGWIGVAGRPRFDFAGRGNPCPIEGERAAGLIGPLSSGGGATPRLYDQVVEVHDVAVDLAGFAEGLATLKAVHDQYRD